MVEASSNERVEDRVVLGDPSTEGVNPSQEPNERSQDTAEEGAHGAPIPSTQTEPIRISAVEGQYAAAVEQDDIAKERSEEAPTTVGVDKATPHAVEEPVVSGATPPSIEMEYARIHEDVEVESPDFGVEDAPEHGEEPSTSKDNPY